MAEYRLTRGYSGIQYRTVELPEIRWAMHGYQADNDAAQQYIRGRFTKSAAGHFWHSRSIGFGRGQRQAGGTGIARERGGNILIQILNGRLMRILMDNGTAKSHDGWFERYGISVYGAHPSF
jgi:hypothetical protein